MEAENRYILFPFLYISRLVLVDYISVAYGTMKMPYFSNTCLRKSHVVS